MKELTGNDQLVIELQHRVDAIVQSAAHWLPASAIPFGDVADLGGEVRREQVDVVGQVLPRAGDTGHLRLAAERAFGADLARHPADFAGWPRPASSCLPPDSATKADCPSRHCHSGARAPCRPRDPGWGCGAASRQ